MPRLRLSALALALAALSSAPALAHDGHGGHGGPRGGVSHSWGTWYGGWGNGWGGWSAPDVTVILPPQGAVAPPPGPPPMDRESWLRECHHRLDGDDRDDRGNHAGDRCEAMLAGGPGYAPYGYGMQMMMVPVMMVPAMMVPAPGGKPHCTETVTTEYVTEPARSRRIPRRAPARDKRVLN